MEVPLGKREFITIFGNNYDTKDGTTVLDYVHVVDLAEVHLLAIDYLSKDNDRTIFNMGSSVGFSTLEIIQTIEEHTQKNIPIKYGQPRAGDPHSLIASSKKIEALLGWKPKYTDLDSMIDSAWKWHENHLDGYTS
ncbi:GDP-mannose 4,6-dehydratase [Enterococcus crotali]|uniref:GDP-mannose 4,6-dehydratase n=1 Tax=Enterococcus crotali TaxID=1453587 RepID=UPI0005508EF9|nr:GDP-mannose 4,6-dehydratase [Enterococcus crotali]